MTLKLENPEVPSDVVKSPKGRIETMILEFRGIVIAVPAFTMLIQL